MKKIMNDNKHKLRKNKIKIIKHKRRDTIKRKGKKSRKNSYKKYKKIKW